MKKRNICSQCNESIQTEFKNSGGKKAEKKKKYRKRLRRIRNAYVGMVLVYLVVVGIGVYLWFFSDLIIADESSNDAIWGFVGTGIGVSFLYWMVLDELIIDLNAEYKAIKKSKFNPKTFVPPMASARINYEISRYL